MNLIIYISYICCKRGGEICVLTVRDNEHDSEHGVRDNKVTCWMLLRVQQCRNDKGNDLAMEPGFQKVGNS